MRRAMVAALGLVLALGTVAQLLSGPAPTGVAVADSTSRTQVREAGSAIYQAQCAACHGVSGAGTDDGPGLLSAGEASADFYLRTGRMPLSAPGQRAVRQDPVLTAAQIELLTQYVGSISNGPPIPTVQSGGDLHKGWELYQANCAACHGATGSGNAIGWGTVAPDLHDADRLEIAEAVTIGPGEMPPFDLSRQDLAALVEYVSWLQTAPSPGGYGLGGLGPVAEGFIAIVAGLVLAILAARFLGARRRGERPDSPDTGDGLTDETIR